MSDKIEGLATLLGVSLTGVAPICDITRCYLKQICYQTTGNMPVYYYISLARQSTDFALSFIEAVPINSASKDLLKRRIAQAETKYCKISVANTEPSKKKHKYLQNLLDEALVVPNTETELKYCMNAMRALQVTEVQEHKNYILEILYEIYTNYFNLRPFSSVKPEFRYLMCWIDEALYMNGQ